MPPKEGVPCSTIYLNSLGVSPLQMISNRVGYPVETICRLESHKLSSRLDEPRQVTHLDLQ